MAAPFSADMTEATRLTREGRLPEAMALLRRALGSPAPVHTPEAAPIAAPALPPPPTTRSSRDANGPGPRTAPRAAKRPLAGLAGLAERFGSGGAPAARRRPAPPEIPAGARFEERVFTGASGTRPYKLYVPSTTDGRARPLVVMLHGCTQSPDDFAAGTRMNALAEEFGFLVAYPGQVRAANASLCWNWFEPADQQRDRGEPALIAGIARAVVREFDADARRVYVAGLSAGGAAAAILGETHPDLFAAVGVHSGLACGAARDVPSAFAAMKGAGAAAGARAPARGGDRTVPTIVFHGDRDTTVAAVNGERVAAAARGRAALETRSETGRSPGGTRYTRTLHEDGDERVVLEHWVLHGAGHAWSGGSPSGSYTDPKGPDASREMIRFFLRHSTAG